MNDLNEARVLLRQALQTGLREEDALAQVVLEKYPGLDRDLVRDEVRNIVGLHGLSSFTVDTNLFKELGELLVGRESTALAELIKNAYDADATYVIVEGRNLSSTEDGVIRIIDDGVGMSLEQFKTGFLTIASRYKSENNIRSPKFSRRVTGAKGIGRLAAHKLARQLLIESRQWNPQDPNTHVILATINWDVIEASKTLDRVAESGAITASLDLIEDFPLGTSITLESLRRSWTESERVRFYHEVVSYTPPEPLIELPDDVLRHEPLFKRPVVRDTEASDPGFNVALEGDFDVGDEFWANLVSASQWLIEVDALKRKSRDVRIRVLPTQAFLVDNPDEQGGEVVIDHPGSDGPYFQSRILVRPGTALGGAPRAWMSHARGIRVYMEGFRVLPYGERSDDWLSLDRDAKARAKVLSLIGDQAFGKPVESEALSVVGNEAYFGAVFLTLKGAPDLRMLVNREGFLPSRQFDDLELLIRKAVQFATRIRARATTPQRAAWRERRETGALRRATQDRHAIREAVEEAVSSAARCTAEARKVASAGDIEGAIKLVKQAADHFSSGSELAERLMTERSLLHVLASVGGQMTAFVHDMVSLIMTSKSIENALKEILRDEARLSPAGHYRVNAQINSVADLRSTLERQTAYFRDIATVDVRRKRENLDLRERFEATLRLFSPSAKRLAIEIKNDIPADLKSPRMLKAELSAIFTNLLSNAIKAAGENGQIRAWSPSSTPVEIRIENSGRKVDLGTADQLFNPFVSDSQAVDSDLGQGMGLGLTIIKNILGELNGEIRFVPPSEEYATSVSILLK